MSTVVPQTGLHALPVIFHAAELTLRFGWSPHVCIRYLYTWKQLGHIAELGGQSQVYANLLASRYPDWELGLRMVMPTGIVIGIEILRRAGWTTQIPYAPTVAVSSTQRVYRIKHYEIAVLPPAWFDSMMAGVLSGEGVALPHLAPAWALADLINREGWHDCGLGPDDIYWNMVTKEDRTDWDAACVALGLNGLPMNPDAGGWRTTSS